MKDRLTFFKNGRLITLIALVASLSFSSLAISQETMSGIVYDQAGMVLDGVVISVLGPDSTSFIDYTLSDAQGKWSLPVPKVDVFVLEYSMFGYGTKYLLITDAMQYRNPLEAQLYEEAFNLDEITIKDKGIGVSQKGDTLNFNLGYFTTGAERTLRDVIKRLPGLEVRDGSVYYGGEKITKMLVQGRDIINQNQKLATEGIRADQLRSIQIIENYKEKAQQFETGESEDVAMDVRLKDNVLNKWSGEVEALGGYPSSAKGSVNAFNLNDKVGISAFVRANNVGEEVLNWSDIQGMLNQSRSGMFTIVSGGSLSALMPTGLWIGEQVQSNRDGIININLDYQANDDIQIKGFAIAAYAERKSEVERRTEYLSEGIERIENSNSSSQMPIFSTVWKMDYQLDSLTFMSLNIPLSYNRGSTDYKNIGIYGVKEFNTVRTSEDDSYLIMPNMLMRRKVGEKGQWSVNMKYENTKVIGDNFFRDDFPFLGVPISSDSVYSILQNRTQYVQQFNAASTIKLMKNDWFISPSAEYAYVHNKSIFDADKVGIADFSKTAELNQQTGVIGISGGYETSDWEVIPQLSLNYFKRTFAQAGEQEEAFPGYRMQIIRKFNRAHRLRLSGSYGLSYPGFDDVKETYEISSATQISTGGIPLNVVQKSYNANLSYNNFNVASNYFIFSRVNYSYSDDVISGLQQQYGDYILSGRTIIPFRQNFSWNLMFGKELSFIPIRVNPRLNYNWSEGFAARQDAHFRVENNTYGASLRLDSKWGFPLNISMYFDYSYNTSIQEGGRETSFESLTPSIGLEYAVGGFKVGTEFGYAFDKGGGENTKLYRWDLTASYELQQRPLQLSVVANNILNLQPKERLVNSFGLDINSFTRYQVFPGYIIAGATWTF